ncbi:hypothetical protein RJ641_010486, partial [Dillenia turbinata]
FFYPTMADETLAGSNVSSESQPTNEATIESKTEGATDSSCNNNNNPESSGVSSSDVEEKEKTLEFSDELMDKGSKALKDNDYAEASECFSRALEIRVAHYGELASECVDAYYKYGCALLYKAQEESDPLVAVPKKEAEPQQDSNKDGSVKSAVNCESSTASIASSTEQDGGSNVPEGDIDDEASGEDPDEGMDSDVEDLAEADEDESDLDLAWKMLDVARAIVEKNSDDMMEKVDILSTLAEVALEREDVETSLSDYLKALSILGRLVEPDGRRIAELNFRICLCLEVGSKAAEAIPYCQKAIAICKSRMERLGAEIESEQRDVISSGCPQPDSSISDKKAEVETLTSLTSDLEKKASMILEDLQQLVQNPTSILAEILEMKARAGEKNASSVAMKSSQMGTATSNGGLESSTVSTAHTNTNGTAGVTHLGVVGRGVKRVVMNSGTAESSPMKKPALEPSSDKGDGSSSGGP